MRIALLASGRGSNVAALLDAKKHGRLPAAEFVVLVTNVEDAGVLEYASDVLPVRVVPHRGLKREEHERRVLEVLREFRVEGLVLAGYMRILTPVLVGAYRGRILNIHPSLLPAFPGVDAQRQALEYGVKITGATVHFVEEGVDSGPIVLQTPVHVLPGDTRDTLADRILHEEHRIYPEAVDLFSRGAVVIDGRRVHLTDDFAKSAAQEP